MRNKMTMCCCYGVEENLCLIHSSIDSKADPWPAYVQESGDAPSEAGDGYVFATPGKIRLDHDDIMHWDGAEFATGRSDYAAKDRKRLIGTVELNSDDACFELTVMDDGVEYCKIRFVSHTPAIAKYPIVSVIRYSKRNNSFTSGVELDTQETILDKWQSGYRIKFYAGSEWYAPWASAATTGSPYNAITPLDPVYIASDTQVYDLTLDPWHSAEWDSDESTSIWLECVNGSVSVTDLELYHDPFSYNTSYVSFSDGPGCTTGLNVPDDTGLCNASGFFLLNTIPGSLYITMPTMTTNPDAEPFASSCADCTAGAGDAVMMLVNPDDLIAFEAFCAFETNQASVACNETEIGVNIARFFPWFVNEGAGIVTITYEQDGDTELIGADIETLPGVNANCPFAYPLAYTDGDNVWQCNASVVLDHVGRSGLVVWQEWKNNTFSCMLEHGELVNIELAFGDWAPA